MKKTIEKQDKFEEENTETTENITLNVVSENKILKFDKCKFSTESETELKVHNQRKHKDLEHPPYDCEFCDKTFGTKALLEKHLKLETWKH